MAKTPAEPPTKLKDAEIIVKRNFGLSSVFNQGSPDLHSDWYTGIAIFANRRGYRFLADYFRWLTERPIAESDWDQGDHVHLTPHSGVCDEIDFTFDTLTARNRSRVLRNAGVTKSSRRCGTPITQFSAFVSDMLEHFGSFLTNDQTFRQSTIDELDGLISVLEKERSRLENMGHRTA